MKIKKGAVIKTEISNAEIKAVIPKDDSFLIKLEDGHEVELLDREASKIIKAVKSDMKRAMRLLNG